MAYKGVGRIMNFVYYEEVEMVLDRALKKDSQKRIYFYDRNEIITYLRKQLHIKSSQKNAQKISKCITRYVAEKGIDLYE